MLMFKCNYVRYCFFCFLFFFSDRNLLENSEVICVSSGTKCINGEQLSLEGCVINDSHSEVVSRRCLAVFFYCQLELMTTEEGREQSIFEPGEDDSGPLFQ